MNNNGPISVSAPGVDLQGATGDDVIFNTRFPFAKLDSTMPHSFEIINIVFNNEPPNPSVGGSTRTLIDQYQHGYNYEPSTFFLISIDNFTTAYGSEGSWLVGNASGVNASIAKLDIEVDATNVSVYVDKQQFVAGPAPNVRGMFISIRAYIFAEDFTATSVPSQG